MYSLANNNNNNKKAKTNTKQKKTQKHIQNKNISSRSHFNRNQLISKTTNFSFADTVRDKRRLYLKRSQRKPTNKKINKRKILNNTKQQNYF